MTRVDKGLNELSLPICPIPRPGDKVLWYKDAQAYKGELVGYAPEGKVLVKNLFGNQYSLPSIDYLRLTDPFNRKGPNWTDLSPHAVIKSPYPNELIEFNKILDKITPPGPRYLELVMEIWSRGYEIFLVGGTVRDIIAGLPTNDVDLVTSMPLIKAVPLLSSMYRKEPEISHKDGYVRLGGTPRSGDPFIDLKMFCHDDPGTDVALFGNQFHLDMQYRDFACNSIYYDPINQTLIDPSGTGISDAQTKSLFIVCDITRRKPYSLGQLAIRFFKFMSRGFIASTTTIDLVTSQVVPALASMKNSLRVNYLRTQLLGKCPKQEHEVTLQSFATHMTTNGAEDAWAKFFEPFTKEILNGSSK